MSSSGVLDIIASSFDVLLNPIIVVVLISLFVASLMLLIVLRKKLSFKQKVILRIVVVLGLLYVAFLVWLIMNFAGHSTAADPVRVQVHYSEYLKQ